MTVACYARLSHENEENSSIENQLSIMENFVQNHKDFYNAEVIKFVDNKSGISLEREEFHKLMTMVRERKIYTIIVKDAYVKLRITFSEKFYKYDKNTTKISCDFVQLAQKDIT